MKIVCFVLQFYIVESSGSLPDTLDIGDVSESGLPPGIYGQQIYKQKIFSWGHGHQPHSCLIMAGNVLTTKECNGDAGSSSDPRETTVFWRKSWVPRGAT
ncbi:unnamed protein product [Prunus armeniaca]